MCPSGKACSTSQASECPLVGSKRLLPCVSMPAFSGHVYTRSPPHLPCVSMPAFSTHVHTLTPTPAPHLCSSGTRRSTTPPHQSCRLTSGYRNRTRHSVRLRLMTRKRWVSELYLRFSASFLHSPPATPPQHTYRIKIRPKLHANGHKPHGSNLLPKHGTASGSKPSASNSSFSHTNTHIHSFPQMIQFHIHAANVQLRQLYYGFIAAMALDRVLIMPKAS